MLIFQNLHGLHNFCIFGIQTGNTEKRLFKASPGRETMHQRKDKQTAKTKRGLEEGRERKTGRERRKGEHRGKTHRSKLSLFLIDFVHFFKLVFFIFSFFGLSLDDMSLNFHKFKETVKSLSTILEMSRNTFKKSFAKNMTIPKCFKKWAGRQGRPADPHLPSPQGQSAQN